MNPIQSTGTQRRSPPSTAKAIDSAYSSDDFLSVLPTVLMLRYNELRDSLSNLISSIDEGSDSSSKCLPLLPHKEELIEVQGRLTRLITSLDELFQTEAVATGYSSLSCRPLLLPQKEEIIEIQNKLNVIIDSIDDESIYKDEGPVTKTIESTSIHHRSPQPTAKAMDSFYVDPVIYGLPVAMKFQYNAVQDMLTDLIMSIDEPITKEARAMGSNSSSKRFAHHYGGLIQAECRIESIINKINETIPEKARTTSSDSPPQRRLSHLPQKEELMRIRDRFKFLTELIIYGAIDFEGSSSERKAKLSAPLFSAEVIITSLVASAMMVVLAICLML